MHAFFYAIVPEEPMSNRQKALGKLFYKKSPEARKRSTQL